SYSYSFSYSCSPRPALTPAPLPQGERGGHLMKTRTIVVQRDEVGRPVVSLLKHHLHISWSQARRLVEQRRVRQGPGLCRDAQSRVRLGQKLRVRLDDAKPPPPSPPPPRKAAGPQPVVRYADAQ